MRVRFCSSKKLLVGCLLTGWFGIAVQAEVAKPQSSRTVIYSRPSGLVCQVELGGLDKLAAKAEESSEVSLAGPLLNLASKFLSAEKGDEASVKEVINGLKGIYVRTFEFAKEGAYSQEDIRAIREQVSGPGWSKLVAVKEADGETVDISACMESGKMAGLAIVAAEPKQLSIVNIVGPIDLDKLSALGGQFGIPALDSHADLKSPAGKKARKK
jgi:Domain of unknown function (DUF4252)